MSSPRKTVLLAALVTALLPLASSPAHASVGERPVFTAAYANSPGMVTLQWAHSGDGVYRFDLYQESPVGYRAVSRDTRIWTVPSLQPNTVYRYKVCAVYAYHQTCSDEDGVGLVSVKTMPPEQPRATPTPTPPAPQPEPPWAPRPIPTPVIKASFVQSDVGTRQVKLTWANPVDSQQFITMMRIDWYRNGAFFNSTRFAEAFDARSDPNATTRYKVCVENAKGRVCSSEITVAPVPVPTTTVVKPGSSSGAKRAFQAAAYQAANPDACKPGYVWRVARASDLVCVTPASRGIVAVENRNAAQNVQPGAAPYCRQGLVWREAFEGDGVCVTPQRRDEVHHENLLGASRRV